MMWVAYKKEKQIPGCINRILFIIRDIICIPGWLEHIYSVGLAYGSYILRTLYKQLDVSRGG